MSRRFAIATVGCKTNQFESSSLSRQLTEHGFTQVPFDQRADIYIVNSCTVTSRADADTRRLVRHCAARNPSAVIVLTGCFAQVARDEAQRLDGVTIVVNNDEKGLIPHLLGSPLPPVNDSSHLPFLPLDIQTERTRAIVRIQTGCNSFCSYCIVPHARGRSRSVPLEEVIQGIRALADEYREIVLTGIHIGMYGRDLPTPVGLSDLLIAITHAIPSARLRLGSIEPLEFDYRLIDLLSTTPSIAPHLHIPVQSGSDTILTLMNRSYASSQVLTLFRKLKERIQGLTIGIDVIAGFPGETEELFQETVDFLERLPFDYAHVFPYSRRKGTAADSMPGHLPPRIVTERSAILRRIADEKRTRWLTGWIGRSDTVLLLQSHPDGYVTGITPSYVPVIIRGDARMPQAEIRCRFTNREGNRLTGETISLFPSSPCGV